MLADSAQVADGKLYILGGGWAVHMIGSPMALIVRIDVPWDLANTEHELRIKLLDTDGHEVSAPGPMGSQPIRFEATFEVGRPPGVAKGSDLHIPFVLNLSPMPLEPAKRYEWHFEIDGNSNPDWKLVFSTAPPSRATE